MKKMDLVTPAADPNSDYTARMGRSSRIYVAGHRGMVGSALVRRLQAGGYENLLLRTHAELDLTDQSSTRAFMVEHAPDFVFLAAAKVGGIHANNVFRVDFLYQNLMIEANVISAAHEAGVERLLFLGSSCIYPRDCPQPMEEKHLLTGPLEITNEPYAIAKIAGIKLCEAYNRQYGARFFSAMPTNLYGPNDSFDLANCHVLPALLKKAHEAKVEGRAVLEVWGSGRPRRELLHVDDLADACVFLMEAGVEEGIYNVGTGTDLTIAELARMVCDVVGFEGKLVFDATKPDGTPRKLLSTAKLHSMGWKHRIALREGIAEVYADFINTYERAKI